MISPDNTTTETLATPWANGNGDIIKEFCSKTFGVAKFESLLIAKAVEGSMRVGDTSVIKTLSKEEEEKLKPVPKDYILLKSGSRLTEEEAICRLSKWVAVIDANPNGTNHPPAEWTMDKFMEVYDNIREVLYLIAVPVINTHFATEFAKRYHGFVFGNNRKVLTMDDWCDFIHMYQPSPELPLANVRAMNHYVLYGMWGSGSNFWAEKGEEQILRLLGFKYDNNRMSNGTVQKRRQRGGWAKNYCVKKLDMEREKVKTSWERVFKEKMFMRNAYKPRNPESTKANAKPDKSHLRKYIVTATRETHGYDGQYLLCEDHPDRLLLDGMPAKTEEQEELERREDIIRKFSEALRSDKRDIPSIVSDLQSKTESKITGAAACDLLAVCNAIIAGAAKCPVPKEVAVVGAPPAKRAKHQHSSPSTGSTSTNSTETTTADVSTLASDLSAEQVAKDAERFRGLEGINCEEPLPKSPAQKEHVRDYQFAVKAPRNYINKIGEAASPTTPTKNKSTVTTSPIKTSERLSPSKPFPMPPLPDSYRCTRDCHNKPSDYAFYNNTYFTATYKKSIAKQNKEKRKDHPIIQATHCLRCNAEFLGAKQKSTSKNVYRVTGEGQVRACQECFTPSEGNRCNRAFCGSCFHMVQPEGVAVAQV